MLLPCRNLSDVFWPREPLAGELTGLAEWRQHPTVASRSLEYAFSAAALERSFAPPEDMGESWSAVFDALEAGEPLSLQVIGGSMTGGIMAKVFGGFYAWPAELALWLRLVRPHWNLTVTNAAVGGIYADTWATRAGLDPADVYIVDTLVNGGQAAISVNASYDKLIWRLLHNVDAPSAALSRGGGSGAPAILSLQTFVDDFYWRGGAEQEAAVARYYGIATVSLRDAIWATWAAGQSNSDLDTYKVLDTDLLDLFWGDPIAGAGIYSSHPTHVAHEFVSDVVKYALLRLAANHSARAAPRRSSRGFGRPPATSVANVGSSCAAQPGGPLTALSPRTGFEPAAPPPSSWRFFEDAPRKPGWIAHWGGGAGGDANATIVFGVAFGAQPRLEVSFLESWHGMGAFNMTLRVGPCSWSFFINGSTEAHQWSVTQTRSLGNPIALQTKPDGAGLHDISLGNFPAAPCVAPPGKPAAACDDECKAVPGETYAVLFEPVAASISGGKVKLLSVTSC